MICARCKFFTMKAHPDRAAVGEGLCIGYLESIQDFRKWDQSTCGIFRPAKPMAPREKWIAERNADAATNGNAAPA